MTAPGLVILFGAGLIFWLAWRSMSRREESDKAEALRPQPELPPEPPSPPIGRRALGVLVASIEVMALVLAVLGVYTLLGWRMDPRMWSYSGTGWIIVGLTRPQLVLDPLARLMRRLSGRPNP